ncbi:rhodanese-like domain-containing protein [Kordia jejudonensis]|uniref:rhodanese-like domain-containing protein n=1 Tax=Kordia jejudonensis TaxID=1348245 RepID=UPI00069A066E|nr:rhodanese-like domain-containing protein [Kordia jejudonensis]
MRRTVFIFVAIIIVYSLLAQKPTTSEDEVQRIEAFTEDFNTSPDNKPLVSFDDYKDLVQKVEKHRAARLIDLATFVEMSSKEDVIILDTRAEDLYKKSHIKGAINLPFTKFTQQNLRRLIPNPETKILIYCNNNIQNDPIHFASKIVLPKNNQPLMLALNIPTYINLYGYGYKNVYELNAVVNILTSLADPSYIQFEGTSFSEK